MAHLLFSNHRWNVTRSAPEAPASPEFAAAGVVMNAAGHLRLRVQPGRSGWLSAEVTSAWPCGYGDYTFDLAGDLRALPPGIALTVGTYRSEGSALLVMVRGETGDGPSAEFRVPAEDGTPGVFSFNLVRSGDHTRFSVSWRPHQVTFACFAASEFGDVLEPIAHWAYAGPQVPSSWTERVRLTFAASDSGEATHAAEVAIARFRFRPFAPPAIRRGGVI